MSKEAAIRDKEALVRERELELQRASSSSTIATYGKREESGALESTGNAESCLDNIEAGRIRFSELSLGPVFFVFGMFSFIAGIFFCIARLRFVELSLGLVLSLLALLVQKYKY